MVGDIIIEWEICSRRLVTTRSIVPSDRVSPHNVYDIRRYLSIMTRSVPILSSRIQSRKLTITIKSILLFRSVKKISLHLRARFVASRAWPAPVILWIRQLFLPSLFSRYNRGNLQSGTSSFYLHNLKKNLYALSVFWFFDVVLPCCLVEAVTAAPLFG